MLAAAVPDCTRASAVCGRGARRYPKSGSSPSRRLHVVHPHLCLFPRLPPYRPPRARPSCSLGTPDTSCRQPSCRGRSPTIRAAHARPPPYACTRALFRRCGMHARTRGSRRRTIPPHHTPSVPWEAASRRLPPGRCGARGAHCSGALDFPGFLGPHACPDPRSHAIDRGRIPGLATRPCGRGPAAVPSRTRGRAPTQH